jgi:hypothetical protein
MGFVIIVFILPPVVVAVIWQRLVERTTARLRGAVFATLSRAEWLRLVDCIDRLILEMYFSYARDLPRFSIDQYAQPWCVKLKHLPDSQPLFGYNVTPPVYT